MKKTLTVAILAIMLSVVSVTFSNANYKPPPEKLQPQPDVVCVCETAYCDCIGDCVTQYFVCLVGTLGTPFYIGCTVAKSVCEQLCEEDYDKIIRETCYPSEPTTPDRINQCVSDCVYRGGDHLDCMVSCGAY